MFRPRSVIDANEETLEKGHGRYFDRELSWLAFNERVLQEAADPNTPVLDRLKFLAIYSSNLDEFFQIRVASLRSLLRLKSKKLQKLDFNPRRVLLEIHQVVDRQQRRFGDLFRNQILPALRENGIHLHVTGSIPSDADYFLSRFFSERVAEHINPILLESGKEPPFLKNGGLYLVVPLWPREELDPLVTSEPAHGIVDIPAEHVGRFIHVAREPGKRHVMFLDDIIRHSLGEIFPFHDTGEAYAIKLTRDAELYIEDEFTGNLVEMIRKSLGKRETGAPTRLLFDQRMPYPVVTALKQRLRLEDEDLVVGGFYHNFSDFFGFPDFGRADLRYEPMPPLSHPTLSAAPSVVAAIRRRDQILHLPYQSFEPVIRLLREAAASSDVTRISVTLYRVAPDSEVVNELINAADSGKEVRAFVEVKARFDERPNIEWARRMESAGVQVLYSMPGLKVHTKLLLVESTAGDIAFLSTGNFNEKTARMYSDHGMFTADAHITADVRRLFDMLEDPDVAPEFETLIVAPRHMRRAFEELVRNEIDAARGGEQASMTLKMNSLVDDGMIDGLYEASRAGVKIRMVVRGICRLIPGEEGLSENIRITSIVDRFLEHARIYVFHARGEELLYLSSADWMPRNLNRRVEVAWPVRDASIRREIMAILALQIEDSVKSRVIDRDQSNRFVTASTEDPVRAQTAIYGMLAAAGRASSPG